MIHAQNQITKLFTVPSNTCCYEELEPVEIQKYQYFDNYLKKGKHFEKEKVKISDLTSKFIFFRIESMFSKLSQKY